MNIKQILLFTLSCLIFQSCTSISKKDAIDYYVKIRFDIAYESLEGISAQSYTVGGYLSHPGKLSEGPDSTTYIEILSNQHYLISTIDICIENLEKMKPIGDDSEFLETLIDFLSIRRDFESSTMLEIVKLLENGMTSEESALIGNDKISQLEKMKNYQNHFLNAENAFKKEFGISEKDIEKGIYKIF